MAGKTVTLKQRPRETQMMYEALAYGMANLGFHIEERAKAGVPVRTGNLRRSIHSVAFRDGRVVSMSGNAPDYSGEMRGIGVIVGTNTNYGIFVELGTVRMAPRPFLSTAGQDGLLNAEALIAAGARARFPDGPS